MTDGTGSAALLQADALTKQVSSPEGTLTILDRVSLAVARGETLAITGPSGSGKSTLLALLAGLDAPTAGRVFLDGVELSALDEDGRAAARARGVGFVFQSFHLLPGLTALENVMLPLELAERADADPAARAVLADVGLAARVGHYPNQLSGGEQQRVAIARAIAKRPEVLLCDEPTGALDVRTGITVLDAIDHINRDLGTLTVIITHNAILADMADRVFTLSDGRIVNVRTNAQRGSVRSLAW